MDVHGGTYVTMVSGEMQNKIILKYLILKYTSQ